MPGQLSKYRLDAPDPAVDQHDFDAVWVGCAFGQNPGNDPHCYLAAALVVLFDHLYAHPQLDFFSGWQAHVASITGFLVYTSSHYS
jgi:hypothetical protein